MQTLGVSYQELLPGYDTLMPLRCWEKKAMTACKRKSRTAPMWRVIQACVVLHDRSIQMQDQEHGRLTFEASGPAMWLAAGEQSPAFFGAIAVALMTFSMLHVTWWSKDSYEKTTQRLEAARKEYANKIREIEALEAKDKKKIVSDFDAKVDPKVKTRNN